MRGSYFVQKFLPPTHFATVRSLFAEFPREMIATCASRLGHDRLTD